MKKYILTCRCAEIPKKAEIAYSILFLSENIPEIYKGESKIRALGIELKNDHILAISKVKDKFAYYVCIDDGKIIEEYNLLTGRRIA